MQTPDSEWLTQIIRHEHVAAVGAESALRTAHRQGRVRRLAPGIYLPTPAADRWDADAGFRALVHATALRHPDEVFSHFSAAALWRLPNLERWPECAESVIDPESGGRSRATLRRHAFGRPQRHEFVDGAAVTDLGRTVVDLASVALFSQAVAFADSALAGLDEKSGVFRAPLRREVLWEQLKLTTDTRRERRRRQVSR